MYGKLDSLTSLVYYGFAQEDNPCESVPVRPALARRLLRRRDRCADKMRAHAQLLTCHEENLRGFPTSPEEDDALLERWLPTEIAGIVRGRLSRKKTLCGVMHHLARRIREPTSRA